MSAGELHCQVRVVLCVRTMSMLAFELAPAPLALVHAIRDLSRRRR